MLIIFAPIVSLLNKYEYINNKIGINDFKNTLKFKNDFRFKKWQLK